MIKPLVSIVVITYNSSEFIIDGLESVKKQTYDNIELIISDDCSTDDTVEICKNWLKENESYFKRVKLVTTTKNTGVAGNLNRGIRDARGEWIKTLSGDDKFLPYTIEKYMDYVTKHKNVDIVFAKLHFYSTEEKLAHSSRLFYEKNFYPKIKLNQKQQYKENLKGLFVAGPGLIFSKKLFEKVRGYDENYPFCDEDPFIFKLLKHGYHIKFLDEELYGYQIRSNSLCREKHTKFVLTRHLRDRIKFFNEVRKSELCKYRLFFYAFDQAISYNLMVAYSKENKNLIYLYKILSFFSPLFWIRQLRRLKKALFLHLRHTDNTNSY